MKIGAKLTISKGRLKGEIITVIGTTNLNMDHRIIIRRTKGRDRILGLSPDELKGE